MFVYFTSLYLPDCNFSKVVTSKFGNNSFAFSESKKSSTAFTLRFLSKLFWIGFASSPYWNAPQSLGGATQSLPNPFQV